MSARGARRLRAVFAGLALAVATVVAAPTALAQDEGEDPAGEIIPRPNSGEAPDEAGDRGGALQLLVLGVVVLAIGGGVALVVRDARRTRAKAGAPGP